VAGHRSRDLRCYGEADTVYFKAPVDFIERLPLFVEKSLKNKLRAATSVMKETILPKVSCVLFAMLLFYELPAQSQTAPVRDSIYSTVLLQNRHLEIFLPPGGLNEGSRYDVFYVLDGEWNITLVREITDFLVNEGLVPPQIIVSILNGEPNMRDRDFTPTHVADNPASGKADNFILFLRNELEPCIDWKYPVSGHNMLFGHSLGGLFGMYALIREPGLFSSYLLGDPSFWWDNHFIYPLTVSALRGRSNPSISLFILGRKGDGSQQLDAAGMDSVLRAVPAAALNRMVVSSPDETHTSTKLRLLVEGLRYVYRGYAKSPLLVNPTDGGIVLAGQPFTLYCYDNYIEPFHYDTDGAWPSESSAPLLYENHFAFNQTTDLVIHSLTTRPDLAQTIKEHFEVGAILKAESNLKGTWIPDKAFTLARLPADPKGWKKLKAYLDISQDGYYDLQVAGASAIRWYLGGKLILSSDSAAVNGHFESVIVPLEKGYYPIDIEVKAQSTDKDPVLLYNTPSSAGNGVALLPELLYSRRKPGE
jgi:predicted alpha/beta superfamily hydrolase